jgi:hypothetical protein
MHFHRHTLALGALVVALLSVPAVAARPALWQSVPRSALDVTEGTVTPYGKHGLLHTGDASMRAVEVDGGRHASRATLWFRLRGASATTTALGSGRVRGQIGLKLLATDPCNLVYVMWHSSPDHAIEIQVKSNPGQTTSAQCGNRGYRTLALVPVGDTAPDSQPRELKVRTLRNADGSVTLLVFIDDVPLTQQTLPADTAAALNGPIGVRSDNGDYVFRLSAGGRA